MTQAVYHIETSPLICSANQWTVFYMITVPIMKELTSELGRFEDVFQKLKVTYNTLSKEWCNQNIQRKGRLKEEKTIM